MLERVTFNTVVVEGGFFVKLFFVAMVSLIMVTLILVCSACGNKDKSMVIPQSVGPPNIIKPLQPLLVYALPITQVVASDSEECASFPDAYTGSLEFPSKYEGSDSARDVVNRQAEAEYEALTASIKQAEKMAVQWSDSYLKGNLKARDCLLDMLNTWAMSQALLHSDTNHIGQAMRKWALATFAHSYLKIIKPVSSAPIDEIVEGNITVWFLSLALEVQNYYSNREIKRVNNHDYWAAWSVMCVALIQNNAILFEWALKKFDEGMSLIDVDGYLISEMKRETRALSYHNYALQPLVFLAAMGEANSYNTFTNNQKKLTQLVEHILEGINDPKEFERRSGAVQYVDGLKTSYSLAWMEVWSSAFPRMDDMESYLLDLRPMRSTRLGGDLTYLFRAEKLN